MTDAYGGISEVAEWDDPSMSYDFFPLSTWSHIRSWLWKKRKVQNRQLNDKVPFALEQ